MPSVNFWHQQDSNSLFKGSIGHVTSWCKWPIQFWKTKKKLAAVVLHFVAVVQEHVPWVPEIFSCAAEIFGVGRRFARVTIKT